MFAAWHDFYLLLGTAAGSLIGLLFVVVTLTSGIDRSRASRGQTLFMTPNLFHLAVVLVVAATALVPGLEPQASGVILAAVALAGFAYAAAIATRLHRGELAAHWSDAWCYGSIPAAIYLGLAAAVATVWLAPAAAPYGIAAALAVLLLVTIRNAWDLVTWLAPKR